MAEEIFLRYTEKKRKKEKERNLWNNIVCRFSNRVFIVFIKFNSSLLYFVYIIKLRQDIFPSNCEKKKLEKVEGMRGGF